MYDVTLSIENKLFTIHNDEIKLKSGTVKQGINGIDSFSFEILPNNEGFNYIYEFKTLISVYNTKREKFEFQGRVLQANSSMSDNGLISKSVVCESFLGYLQDTEQEYDLEQNRTPSELLTHLLTIHNDMLSTEPEKHFKVGTIFTDENIYVGIQRESTWECIKKKIIEKIGGEIQLRIEDDGMYIDIVEERGSIESTTIELSKNMKSITQENDSSSYITRLIPLGAKITKEETSTDEEGNESTQTIETEERIDITSVNDGKNYIDDLVAIQTYGIHIKHEYWDDVHEPSILKTKATNFLSENNKVLQKYSINALDLAILDIDISYIDVCNYYPVKNALLGIDDTLRVITKTIDIVNESNTSFEIGDKFKTLTDLEIEKINKINAAINTIEIIEKNYVTNQAITNVSKQLYSSIEQNSSSIMSKVSETYTSKSEFEEYQQTVSTTITQTKDSIDIQFTNYEDELDGVKDSANAESQERKSLIRLVDGRIILGLEGNDITLVQQNDRISFLQNGIEVAYFSNNKLYVTEGEFLSSLKIGNFAYIPRSDGSLDFKKVGD